MSCSVLQRIEGATFVDYLTKGKPDPTLLESLAQEARYTVYPSAWEGRWIVRVDSEHKRHYPRT